MSVIIDFDREANVKNYKITPSVIKTCERMTYTQVNKILEDKDEEMISRFNYLVDDLEAMRELAENFPKSVL